MHYQRQQQRRQVIVFFIIIALVAISSTYTIFSMHSMSKLQEQTFLQIQNEFNDFKDTQALELNKIKNEYDVKLERFESSLESARADFDRSTKSLVETIEEKDNEKDIELEEIRQELKSVNKGDLSELVKDVVKAAVSITTERDRGSGAVLTGDGYIVTNYHVVTGAQEITVIDYSGRVSEATLVQYNELRDLAILKVDKDYDDVFKLGNSDELEVGETVIAIGSPKSLDFTVTQGIISAVSRVFDEEEGSFIQTDVPINSGSSGGPLVNLEGELIGLNTFKLKGTDSLGFSIPSNDVKTMLDNVTQS